MNSRNNREGGSYAAKVCLFLKGHDGDNLKEFCHIVAFVSILRAGFIEARLYNSVGELCTETTCAYFTFPQEKAKTEMYFHHCDVESEEILPLI